jgi:hypothetical protein
MGSADPFLTALKAVGLSVIKVPRAGVGPLTLLTRDGHNLSAAGPLEKLLAGGTLPEIGENQPAADIRASKTRGLDGSLALNLLSGWLEALGGKSAGMDTHLGGGVTVAFEFPEVLIDTVKSAVDLDAYLGAARINTAAAHHVELLSHRECFVVTLAAKTRKLQMTATRRGGGSLALNIPEIQKVVGGGITVSSTMGAEDTVVYEGPTPVYFGFKAIQLFFRDGRYEGFGTLPAGRRAMLGAPPDGESKYTWFGSGSPLLSLDWEPLVE